MQLTDFPGCCGAGVIFRLDAEYDRQRCSPEKIIPVDDYTLVLGGLKSFVKVAMEHRWGLLTATTNEKQTKVEELLTKCGFKLLHSFLNPMHNNSKINLWGLDLYNFDLNTLENVTNNQPS